MKIRALRNNYLYKGNGDSIDVAEFLQYNHDNPNNKSITIIHSLNVLSRESTKTSYCYCFL